MVGRPKHYEVLLTQGTEQDLESIHDYISEFRSAADANHVLDRSMEVVEGLAQSPERGTCPKELVALEVLLGDGWVVGTLDPQRPKLTMHTPEEGRMIHTHRDTPADAVHPGRQ